MNLDYQAGGRGWLASERENRAAQHVRCSFQVLDAADEGLGRWMIFLQQSFGPPKAPQGTDKKLEGTVMDRCGDPTALAGCCSVAAAVRFQGQSVRHRPCPRAGFLQQSPDGRRGG